MGYNATTEDLLKYGIGLGLFSNVSTLEEAQNILHSSVQRLKVLCLLLEGGTNKKLVMHDVVRDVGRWISAKEDDVLVVSDENKKKEWSDADKLKTCTRIWIFGSVHEVPEMHCPKLLLAHVDGKNGSLTVPDNLFKGLHKLKVLSFTNFTFSSLPSSLCLLENLKTLCFHLSMELEGVSIIGKLTKLEVLSFAESNITHLPVEIGQLTKLKLLDLSGCYKLEMIPPNILSRLYQLEELYMSNSFDRWTVEGQESQDTASLGELKQLVSLTNLEISIRDARLVSKDIFPKKLCRYKIFIGSIEYWNKKCRALTNLKLKLNANLQIEKGLMRLVKKTEDLYLVGLEGVKNFVYDLDNDGFPKLKHLHLRDSPEVQYFVDMTNMGPSVAFPVLESLYLEKLISLEKIYQSRVTSQYFFSKLRTINVNFCDRLTHLFLFSVAQGLSQLQTIEVGSCASLETVVAEATNVIEFSQLESLMLYYLPKLTSLCSNANPNATNLLETNVNEDVNISMPLLNQKILLPNLKKMVFIRIDNMETLWHGGLPAIKNSFQNLTALTVSGCNRLKCVFSYSLIKCLGQLQSLHLRNCRTLEEVMLVEEESGEEQLRSSKAVLLPKLQSIDIGNLPELKRFCKGYLVECPLLKELSIWGCPQLKTFVSQECEQVRLDVEKNDQTAKLRKPLFDEMVVFPSLAKLKLWGCEKLADIFPPILILLERFQKLEVLDISHCDCVEEIFGVEGFNNAEHISFQLKRLYLESLAKLRHIWTKDSSRLFTFPNLCKVNIKDCSILRHVFPRPIAENLLELEELTVRTSWVDEIVAPAENGEEAEVHPLMWPKLKMLDIPDPLSLLQKINSNLEELAFDGRDTSPSQILNDRVHFSKLKVVKLHHFMDEWAAGGIPFGFLQKLPNLEKLCVGYSSFRELFSCEGVVADSRVPSCLKHLSLTSLNSLRHIWEQNDFILASPLLQSIETLEVWWCGSLVTLAPSSASFKNLTTLSVSNCSRLLSLVTASTAKSLGQLINFQITDCKMMEIIDREGDEADNIIFTKLQCLELVRLESLTSFCSGDHTFSFPSLKEMIVVKCPKMRVFCAGHISTPKLHKVYLEGYVTSNTRWEGNLNSTIQKLYIEKVGFDGMDDLKLSEFPELKEVWHGPLPGKLFSNLLFLEVDDCSFFSSAVPSNLLPSLGNLKLLRVRNCDSLEEVFDLERLNADEDHVELLPTLEVLRLSDLPRLLNIWNKNSPIVLELKCLTRLEIHNCPSLQNIFTPSMAVCLVRLEKIEIRNCIALEELSTEEKAGEATTDQTTDVVALLPKLNELQLSNLPRLQHICNKNSQGFFEFQRLEKLIIHNCSSLRRVFTTSIAICLVKLQIFEIRNCEMLEEIFTAEKAEETEREKATIFPLLHTLILECLPNLVNITAGNGSQLEFPSLAWISIEKCPNMKPFFSHLLRGLLPEVVHEGPKLESKTNKVAFPCLTDLRLEWYDTLSEIMHGLVADEYFGKLNFLELINLSNDHIVSLFYFLQRFPNIHYLVLSNAHFEEIVTHDEAIGEDQHAKLLANLRSLKLSELSKLVRLKKEDTLLCSVFQRLESLEVVKCGIMGILVPSFVSFQWLRTLEVSECNDLLCLITSAAAGSLMLLKRLTVRKCRTIEQIIANEENLVGKTVNFCKLKKLELHCLPSLMSFFSWNCALIFPSLKKVFVSECPKLKIFSQGVVGTPELIRVYVEEGKGKSCWEGSLNATIQKIFIEMHEDQSVPMSNQAESSKQPNLNAEDAQQQNSGTCDVPEGQIRKAIHVNENPDAVEALFTDIGATNTITTKQQSLEAKEDPTLNQISRTPLDIKDDIVLHPQVDPYATDENEPIPLPLIEQISNVLVPLTATEVASLSFSTSTTKTAYSQMGENISTSEDSHITKNPDYWKDLFPEIEPTKNIRAEEHAANGSLVELVITEMAMTYLHSHIISNDQDQAMTQSVHQSSMTQPNIDHIETDEPRDIKTFEVSEGSTYDELHTSKNLNESNSLEIVEEGIVTGSYVEPEMTQITSTRQDFHFTVDDKESTPDQGARQTDASGVVTPLPASELSHLSQDKYLKCIRTPDDHFMDSSFAQNAIELFEWKINADRDHLGVYFLAELVVDLKQLHTSEENLSLGANPPMRTNEHKNTLGKCIEELNEVDEKIQEYENALGD